MSSERVGETVGLAREVLRMNWAQGLCWKATLVAGVALEWVGLDGEIHLAGEW